jgi:predicted Abi (CAAX) family protease
MKRRTDWTWLELNEWLKKATEGEVAKRLRAERARHPKRVQFVRRIHSRLNKMRADRERQELTS